MPPARLLTLAYVHPNLMLAIVAVAFALLADDCCQDPIDWYK
jgi:hypothetical protein